MKTSGNQKIDHQKTTSMSNFERNMNASYRNLIERLRPKTQIKNQRILEIVDQKETSPNKQMLAITES